MPDTKEPTCDELIDKRLTDRLEQLTGSPDDLTEEECRARLDDYGRDHPESPASLDDWREAARELDEETRWDELLSIDTSTVYTVLMSTGGPADWFELIHDGQSWTGGFYVYQDWYDGARRRINSATAETLADRWSIWPDYR